MRTMLEDIDWLNERRFLYLYSYTRLMDMELAPRTVYATGNYDGQEREQEGGEERWEGDFVIRPSYSRRGKLVVSYLLAKQDRDGKKGPPKVEHSVLFDGRSRHKAEHIVVDSRPETHKSADRPLRGLKDFIEWLVDGKVHPSFLRGCGKCVTVPQAGWLEEDTEEIGTNVGILQISRMHSDPATPAPPTPAAGVEVLLRCVHPPEGLPFYSAPGPSGTARGDLDRVCVGHTIEVRGEEQAGWYHAANGLWLPARHPNGGRAYFAPVAEQQQGGGAARPCPAPPPPSADAASGRGERVDLQVDAGGGRRPIMIRFNCSRAGELGRGSFGRVYRGIDRHTARAVAVKQLPWEGIEQKELERCQAEARLMCTLDHANVVKFYGSTTHGGNLYLVMEMMAGTLHDEIARGAGQERQGGLCDDLVRQFGRAVVQGLAYLHSQRIIHRDVKPTNILVNYEGKAKLSDFGCSKQVLENKAGSSGTKGAVGTPHYMAQEVIRAATRGQRRDAKPSDDVWALGCTILEMHTGRRPWAELRKETALALIVYLGTTEDAVLLPPATAPEPLQAVLRSCLHQEPAQRATCDELLQPGAFSFFDPDPDPDP